MVFCSSPFLKRRLADNVAPYRGDELTSLFAPSRRDKNIRPWPKDKCVVCAPNLSKKADDRERDTARGGGGGGAKKKAAAPVGIGPPVNLNLDDDNGDSDKEEDDDDKGGPLEDVPDCACTLMGPNSGHRIHTACLQKLQAADPNWECPRCQDLRRRAAIGADDGVTYCAAIRGGFKASTSAGAAPVRPARRRLAAAQEEAEARAQARVGRRLARGEGRHDRAARRHGLPHRQGAARPPALGLGRVGGRRAHRERRRREVVLAQLAPLPPDYSTLVPPSVKRLLVNSTSSCGHIILHLGVEGSLGHAAKISI